MRKILLIATALALACGALVPNEANAAGGFKAGGFKPGGFKSSVFKPGGFNVRSRFAVSFKKGIRGKAFSHRHHGKPGKVRHARGFHHPHGFAFGLPVVAVARTVSAPRIAAPQPEPAPRRAAEWRIYRVGDDSGCKAERVDVPRGTVTVYRC